MGLITNYESQKIDSMMDSIKVTGITTSMGFVYWTDIISGVLMCVMFAFQIYYLYLKSKRIKKDE